MDDEQLARITANVIGPSSAAAKALETLERRRAAGEDVVIFERKSTWWVGPREHPENVKAAKGMAK